MTHVTKVRLLLRAINRVKANPYVGLCEALGLWRGLKRIRTFEDFGITKRSPRYSLSGAKYGHAHWFPLNEQGQRMRFKYSVPDFG